MFFQSAYDCSLNGYVSVRLLSHLCFCYSIVRCPPTHPPSRQRAHVNCITQVHRLSSSTIYWCALLVIPMYHHSFLMSCLRQHVIFNGFVQLSCLSPSTCHFQCIHSAFLCLVTVNMSFTMHLFIITAFISSLRQHAILNAFIQLSHFWSHGILSFITTFISCLR